MAMTRRDFQAIAEAIKVASESMSGESNRQLLADMTKAIATHANRTNANFSFNRFYVACGWSDYEIGHHDMI